MKNKKFVLSCGAIILLFIVFICLDNIVYSFFDEDIRLILMIIQKPEWLMHI